MKKQRLGAVVLVSALVLGLTGCGNSQANVYKKHVQLGDYKNIEYTKTVAEVTDDDVAAKLEEFVNGLATNDEVTGRAVQEGDIVNIDFTGTMDGEEFEGGSSQGFDLTIGTNMFIDGFEDALIGHNIGDDVSVDLKFPDPYPNNEDLAGKPVNFAVKINSISVKNTPQLSDQLVADNDDKCKTVDEYKEKVRKELAEQNEATAKQEVENTVMNTVIDNATIDGYEEEEVKELVDKQYEQFTQSAQSYQTTVEEMIKMYGYESEEDLMEDITQYVKSYLDMKMVIYCIADKEGIKVTGDEVQAAAEEEAAMYGAKAEDVIKFNGEDYYEYKLLSDRVKQVILDSAKLVDSTEAAEDKKDDEKAEDKDADKAEEKEADSEEASEEAAE